MKTSISLPSIKTQRTALSKASFASKTYLLCSAIAFAFVAVPLAARAQYYSNTGVGTGALNDPNFTGIYDTAVGYNALHYDTTGNNNTGIGGDALQNNESGSFNTATGVGTLFRNQTGSNNTANGSFALQYTRADNNTGVGYAALENNTSGAQNTATGTEALKGSTGSTGTGSTGSYNTATGFQSLFSISNGGGNVADGWQALYSNQSGGYNTGIGVSALRQNTTGNQNTATGVNALYHNNGANNTATGFQALQNNTTGGSNIALGYQAGFNLTTGSNNIVIGAGLLGKAGEANTTRIGKTTQAAAYIGGIYSKGVAGATGVPVKIDSTGKLGTVLSSARYKDHIKPMEKASEAILQLEPVTFQYKREFDPDGVPQFGLIAEQVEKVNPDLVVRDEDGMVSTVRYEAVNAMLLNEFLKEHRTVEVQQARIAELTSNLKAQQRESQAKFAQQQTEMEALKTGLQKVSAVLELNKLLTQVTLNQSSNR